MRQSPSGASALRSASPRSRFSQCESEPAADVRALAVVGAADREEVATVPGPDCRRISLQRWLFVWSSSPTGEEAEQRQTPGGRAKMPARLAILSAPLQKRRTGR